MAPAVSDAEYIFQLFCDSGPLTLNTGDIAKKRGISTGSIWSKLKLIKKRHPEFQLSVSAKGGSGLSADVSTVTATVPKATPAPSPRKKTPAKANKKSIASTVKTENRRRTRSVSRAHIEASEDEDDLTIISREVKDQKMSAQTDEDDSDEENEDDKQVAKPTPKTRGGRKSVGRELDDEDLPELPKPVPRGRNASKLRALIAENGVMDSSEENEPEESVEVPEKTSPMKIKSTEFTKKLMKSSEDPMPSSKRKRTPSDASVSPASPTEMATKKDSPKTLQHVPQVNSMEQETTSAASFLTPPISPSKRPPTKKQKLIKDERNVSKVEEAIQVQKYTPEQIEPTGEELVDQFIQPAAFSAPDMPTCGLITNDEFPTGISGDDRQRDDSVSCVSGGNEATTAGKYAWMTYDSDAEPDPSSGQGLGKVVSN